MAGVSGVVALANALRWLPSQAEPGYLNGVFPLRLLQSMSCSAYFCGIYSAGFLLCCSVDALYCSSVGLGASRCRVCTPGDLIVGEHAPLGALVSQGILCGV